MPELDRVMNHKIVRSMFNFYSGRGEKYIEELFGKSRVISPLAPLARLPILLTFNKAMKKLGLNKRLIQDFLSQYWHRQTLLNAMSTVGKYGLKQPFRFDAPLVIVWNYTNLCNLRCRYCYQSAGASLKDELSFEEKINLIDQMVEAHVAYIAFSGGEPAIGERFWEVLSYASRFVNTSIATNGIIFKDASAVKKAADCGTQHVFVSLDGAAAASHDFIRGEGSFEKTIRGIKNLVKEQRLSTGINMVVTRRNLYEVPAVLKLAQELGVKSFSHYNFIPTGRGKDDFENDLTPEEREDLLNLFYDWLSRGKQTGLSIISTSPVYARIIYDRSSGRGSGLFHLTTEISTAISGIIKYAGGCGAGRIYAAIQPNGLMTPCVFMPWHTIGDTRKEPFIDIWRNSELCKAMVDREHYHFHCPKYRYICGGCRARAHAYGDVLGCDPGCAEYQRLTGGSAQTAAHAYEREEALVS